MTYRDSFDGSLHLQHKYRENTNIDTGSVPEDVWEGGGLYPFPSAAETTTIVSDNDEDGAGRVNRHVISTTANNTVLQAGFDIWEAK